MKRKEIIMFGILMLLTSCMSENNLPNSNKASASTDVNSQSQVTNITPTVKPTAYPLPEETNYNRKVVLISNFGYKYKMSTINQDGTDEKELTAVTEDLSKLDKFFISLDGKKIYYIISGMSTGTTSTSSSELTTKSVEFTGINYDKLYSINVDGTDKKLLYEGRASMLLGSTISKDRTKVIFYDNYLGNGNIYIYDLEKEKLTKLDIIGRISSLSPDNSKIVFFKEVALDEYTSVEYQLYTSNVDGTNVKLIISDINPVFHPQWLPTGEILFEYIGKQGKRGLYTIKSDGSNLKDFFIYVDNLFPARVVISPDGEKMLYDKYDGISKYKLIVANIDNTNPIELANNGGVNEFGWSSDSKRILFYGEQLSVINADGTGLKTLSPKYIKIPNPSNMNPDGYRIEGVTNMTW